MNRIKTSFFTRVVAGSYVRAFCVLFLAVSFPLALIMPAVTHERSDQIALYFMYGFIMTTLVLCAVCYIKCGIFYSDTEIIERRLFSTKRIAMNSIEKISLDILAGSRYYENYIRLYPMGSSVPSTDIKNINFFSGLFTSYDGSINLSTVKFMIFKKSAWTFAAQLIKVIRTHGSPQLVVQLPKIPEPSGIFGGMSQRASYKFWTGFNPDV